MSEIIEIGVCVVDLLTLERRERRSLLVKPARSDVGEFCTQLTGITPAMVAAAVPLADALQILRDEYRSPDRLFASWGDYDRDQFLRNCHSYDLPYPFGPTHLNVKNLYSAAFGLPRELGLDEACARLGLTMDGAHHRGVDDAWNVARILGLLLKRIRRAS
jgi:inhibitor of KinA sporulation pathway (predicted exonuclease)